MNRFYADWVKEDSENIKMIQDTIKEFDGFSRKHIFNKDQSIFKVYKNIVQLLNIEISRIKIRWTE